MKSLTLPRLKSVAALCAALFFLLPLYQQTALAGQMTPEEIAAVKGDGIDHEVKAGDDFNRYANGGWAKSAKIPDSEVGTGVFDMLAEESDLKVKKIIDDATKAAPGSPERKIGDYYLAYLNTEAIDKLGLAPIKARMDEIASINDTKSLANYLGKTLEADVDPINATNVFTENLFGMWVSQAFHDHTKYVGYLMQGGLGLPDREYYLSRAPEMVALRKKYRDYVAATLKQANVADYDAAATRILALETKIAAGHAKREATSDPLTADHTWKRDEFSKQAPGLDWDTYFAAAKLDKQPAFIIWHPSALKNSSALVAKTPIATWKEYLTYHAISQRTGVLPHEFFDLKFGFFKNLSGAKEPQPRWKYAVDAVNFALGEEVGKVYVAQNFSPEAKARIQSMVADLLDIYTQRVSSLTWMAPSTKAEAIAKIKSTYVGVGYPDKWRDYSGLEVRVDDAYGNRERTHVFNYQQALAKFDKPVDVAEWCMNAQLVNAVNMPLQNAVNFPAAYLQDPNFNLNASIATNYGAIGATIGHEVSHSFDNAGATFDSKGELRNWWTKADLAHFKRSGQALVEQFNKYKPFPDLAVKGQQTLGENIADLAGLMAAYDAYHAAMKRQGLSITPETEREFFLAYAKSFRGKIRDEALRNVVITNEHAPEQYRVQTVRNLDAWYDAFDVKPGQALYLAPKDRVKVW